jgi:hypothetical protein
MIGYAVDVTASAARARIPERIAAALAAQPSPSEDAAGADAPDRAIDVPGSPETPPEPVPAASARPPESTG